MRKLLRAMKTTTYQSGMPVHRQNELPDCCRKISGTESKYTNYINDQNFITQTVRATVIFLAVNTINISCKKSKYKSHEFPPTFPRLTLNPPTRQRFGIVPKKWRPWSTAISKTRVNRACTYPLELVVQPLDRATPLATQVSVAHQHLRRCVASADVPNQHTYFLI